MADDVPVAASRGRSRARVWENPAGRLVLPFALGVALTLIMAAALRVTLTAGWVLAAIAVGVVFTVFSITTAVLGSHSAAKAAHASTGADGEADPLGHIHAVEQQGRRLRRACVNCGTPVPLDRDECPGCGHKQTFKCKRCGTPVRPEWKNCPECGKDL